ncbi:hypothetical protein HYC85_003976 [Camellia sinensis]|uniref:Uncharacterized protein n=1 Tax=Camellia sinensis TaxID=4442 RepID=A0A7J7HWX9_CAMSI|nr:hypothetical protein HYC85_003976 [Camellia sinensis]
MATWRKQRNRIACLKLADGSFVTNPNHIQQQFVQHFTQLYEGNSESFFAVDGSALGDFVTFDVLNVVNCHLTTDHKSLLDKPFLASVVKHALFKSVN